MNDHPEEENELIEESPKPDFRDNEKRANAAIYIFFGIIAIDILSILVGILEYDILTDIQEGYNVAEDLLSFYEYSIGMVGLAQFTFNILSIIVFLAWFRRAYANLHRIGVKDLEYSETMSIWGFIIPIISLYIPYKIAKEIAFRTDFKLKKMLFSYESNVNTFIINAWWFLFLISGFVSNISARLILKDEYIEDMINSTMANFVADILEIPAAIFAVLFIRHIAKKERLLFNSIHEERKSLILNN